MTGEEGEYKRKRESKTKLEIMKTPDQYEGKDISRHMSEMEELVKSSVTMKELVVRQFILTRYRLSLITPCEYCYDKDWRQHNTGMFCCEKHEIEDGLQGMDIDEEMWTRRKDTGDTAQESIELFYNNIVGDLMVIDARLVQILSEPPYMIIDKRDYSTEKRLRKRIWETIDKELGEMDMREIADAAKEVEELVIEPKKEKKTQQGVEVA